MRHSQWFQMDVAQQWPVHSDEEDCHVKCASTMAIVERTRAIDPPMGLETVSSVRFAEIRDDSRTNERPRIDVNARDMVSVGPDEDRENGGRDRIEAALARSISLVAEAGQWEVVTSLARELKERSQLEATTRPRVQSAQN